MPQFRVIGHIDTMRVASKVYNLRDSLEPVIGSAARVLELRRTESAEGGEIVSAPVLKDWIHMRTLLTELQRLVQSPMLGLVFLECLPPLATVDWQREDGAYFERHVRLHLPIATNPYSHLYAGGEVFAPQVGVLTAANVLVPHCAANFGATPRYHLIIDVERAEQEPQA